MAKSSELQAVVCGTKEDSTRGVRRDEKSERRVLDVGGSFSASSASIWGGLVLGVDGFHSRSNSTPASWFPEKTNVLWDKMVVFPITMPVCSLEAEFW